MAVQQENHGFTWGGLIKGVVKIAAVVAVGVGLFIGGGYVAGMVAPASATAGTIGGLAASWGASASGLTAQIGDIAGNIVEGVSNAFGNTVEGAKNLAGIGENAGSENNLNGQAPTPDPFPALGIDVAETFGAGYTQANAALVEAQNSYLEFKQALVDNGLWERFIAGHDGAINLDALFAGATPAVGSIPAAIPADMPALQSTLSSMTELLNQGRENAVYAFDAATAAIEGTIRTPEIQANLLGLRDSFLAAYNSAGEAVGSVAGSVHEALGINQGAEWKAVAGVGAASAVAGAVIGRHTGKEAERRNTQTAIDSALGRA